MDLRTGFSLAVHTTRVPRPGRHAVDVIVNGQALSARSFHVIAKLRASSAHVAYFRRAARGETPAKRSKVRRIVGLERRVRRR